MAIDWSDCISGPELTVYCRCGTMLYSHAKEIDGVWRSRKPCPLCRRTDNIFKVEGPPEIYWNGKEIVRADLAG